MRKPVKTFTDEIARAQIRPSYTLENLISLGKAQIDKATVSECLVPIEKHGGEPLLLAKSLWAEIEKRGVKSYPAELPNWLRGLLCQLYSPSEEIDEGVVYGISNKIPVPAEEAAGPAVNENLKNINKSSQAVPAEEAAGSAVNENLKNINKSSQAVPRGKKDSRGESFLIGLPEIEFYQHLQKHLAFVFSPELGFRFWDTEEFYWKPTNEDALLQKILTITSFSKEEVNLFTKNGWLSKNFWQRMLETITYLKPYNFEETVLCSQFDDGIVKLNEPKKPEIASKTQKPNPNATDVLPVNRVCASWRVGNFNNLTIQYIEEICQKDPVRINLFRYFLYNLIKANRDRKISFYLLRDKNEEYEILKDWLMFAFPHLVKFVNFADLSVNGFKCFSSEIVVVENCYDYLFNEKSAGQIYRLEKSCRVLILEKTVSSEQLHRELVDLVQIEFIALPLFPANLEYQQFGENFKEALREDTSLILSWALDQSFEISSKREMQVLVDFLFLRGKENSHSLESLLLLWAVETLSYTGSLAHQTPLSEQQGSSKSLHGEFVKFVKDHSPLFPADRVISVNAFHRIFRKVFKEFFEINLEEKEPISRSRKGFYYDRLAFKPSRKPKGGEKLSEEELATEYPPLTPIEPKVLSRLKQLLPELEKPWG